MYKIIRYSFLVLLTGILFVLVNTGCSKAGRTMCDRDNTFKKSSNLKNRTNYSSRYSNKSRPVKKDYVIRNKKTGKRY